MRIYQNPTSKINGNPNFVNANANFAIFQKIFKFYRIFRKNLRKNFGKFGNMHFQRGKLLPQRGEAPPAEGGSSPRRGGKHPLWAPCKVHGGIYTHVHVY